MRRRFRRQCRCDSGMVALEFVIIAPILIFLTFGIVEFGRYYNAEIAVTHAAREASRKAAFFGTLAEVKAAATAASPNLTVDASLPTPCALGSDQSARVTVTAVFSWSSVISAVPGFPTTTFISKTGVMRCGV